MSASKYHELSTEQLNEQVTTLKNELFNLRFQMAIGQLANPMVIRECKRNIARVKTILRDREIKGKAL